MTLDDGSIGDDEQGSLCNDPNAQLGTRQEETVTGTLDPVNRAEDEQIKRLVREATKRIEGKLGENAKDTLGEAGRQAAVIFPCEVRVSGGYGYQLGSLPTRKNGFVLSDKEGFGVKTSVGIVTVPLGTARGSLSITGAAFSSGSTSISEKVTVGGTNGPLFLGATGSGRRFGGVEGRLGSNIPAGQFFLFGEVQAAFAVTEPCERRQ